PADVALPVGPYLVRVLPLLLPRRRVEAGDRLVDAVGLLGPGDEDLALGDGRRTPAHLDLRPPDDGRPVGGPGAEEVFLVRRAVAARTLELAPVVGQTQGGRQEEQDAGPCGSHARE